MSKITQNLLGSFVRIRTGKLDANANDPSGEYPFFTCSRAPLQISTYSYDCECVLVAGNGDLNVKYYKGKFDAYQRTYIIEVLDPKVLSPKYLFRFLSTYIEQLRHGSIGGVIKFIKLGHLTQAPISILPLVEQERIVKLLDEADELRKLRDKSNCRSAALIPAIFHKMFGDPTYLETMNWSLKPVGEFAKVSYGLADKLDASTRPEDGVRILTISNVLLEGLLDTTVKKYSVADPAERAKAQVQNLDLLFNWRNGSAEHIGKTALWEEQIQGEVLHVSFLLKIRADQSQANPYFLWVLLNRLRDTGFFMRNARMQINRKFNASELSALKLPLPPLTLQKEFAASVGEIRAMQFEQAASRKRLDDLFQSMLHRAFNGEL